MTVLTFPTALPKTRSRLCGSCGSIPQCDRPIAICACPDPTCGSDQIETILLAAHPEGWSQARTLDGRRWPDHSKGSGL